MKGGMVGSLGSGTDTISLGRFLEGNQRGMKLLSVSKSKRPMEGEV